MSNIPENMKSLHAHEEKLRTESLALIQDDEALVDHVNIIFTALDSIQIILSKYKHANEDELTIQLLGIRIFNSSISSLKLLLSGYFQGAVGLQRDILETGFLIDYFKSEPTKISDWANCTSRERRSRYAPFEIRNYLDDRDDFEGKRREKVYQLMSQLGSHPDPEGFRMIIKEGLGAIGPFVDESKTRPIINEMAKWTPLFALKFIEHFDSSDMNIVKNHIYFMDQYNSWAKKYTSSDPVTDEISEIKKLLSEIE